ncbi:MAG: hypothetical protein JXR64_02560 [Spirochaetales bacterium]|nr:hypothetical protein [Spirochaetales bacterium]
MKRSLNTIISGRTAEKAMNRFVYWGASLLKDTLTTEAVLALDGCNMPPGYELRQDRYKKLTDYDVNQTAPIGEGKYIVFCIPLEFGGNGRFQTSTFVYNFELLTVIEDFIDANGKVYPMQVYVSFTKFHGIIDGDLIPL